MIYLLLNDICNKCVACSVKSRFSVLLQCLSSNTVLFVRTSFIERTIRGSIQSFWRFLLRVFINFASLGNAFISAIQ